MFTHGSPRACSFSAVPGHVHSRQSPFMFILDSPHSCSLTAVPGHVHSRQSPVMFLHGSPLLCSLTAVLGHVHSRQSPFMFINGSPRSCSFSAVPVHVHSRQSQFMFILGSPNRDQETSGLVTSQPKMGHAITQTSPFCARSLQLPVVKFAMAGVWRLESQHGAIDHRQTIGRRFQTFSSPAVEQFPPLPLDAGQSGSARQVSGDLASDEAC